MKQRLKGLICWWVAIIMVICIPISAFAENVNVYIIKDVDINTAHFEKVGRVHGYDVTLGMPLNEHLDMVNDVVGEGFVLNGWKLWRGYASGGEFVSIDDTFTPLELSVNDPLSEETYNSVVSLGGFAPALEPLTVMKYKIDPQPTNDNPTVGVMETSDGGVSFSDITDRDDVTYQWYGYDKKSYKIVDENPGSDDIETTEIYKGAYSPAEEIWGISEGSSSNEIDIIFPVEAGDVISVTPVATDDSTELTAAVREYNSPDDLFTLENGEYTKEITAEDSGEFNLYITEFAQGVSFKICVINKEIGDIVDGETEKTLSTRENGEYVCRVTVDGVVMTSNPVDYVAPDAFTVVWKNDDGTVLETDENVAYGVTPEYNGETPQKAEDGEYTYTFAGWTPEIKSVTENAEYTAIYTQTPVSQTSYTVTFDSNGGSDVAAATVSEGEKITKPADPTRSGYSFLGWYTLEDNYEYDFESVVSSSFTLYAKWQRNQSFGGGGGGVTRYTIKFETDDGSTIVDIKIPRNSKLPKPEDPTKAGFIFGGWYTDEELKNEYDFDSKVTKSFTLYAKWSEIAKEDNSSTGILNRNDHFAFIAGYADGTVRPEDKLRRSEAATIFFRLIKDDVIENNLSDNNEFDDVLKEAWYNSAVSTMVKLGIVKGRAANIFAPDELITRAEFAAICARFDESEFEITETFTDIEGHWAENEILKATARGYVKGYEDGTFRPDGFVTRAEAIALINRVLGRTPKSVDDLHDDMITWVDNSDKSSWYYLDIQEATNDHSYNKTSDDGEKWTEVFKK